MPMWVAIGSGWTPTMSVGSSLSCQLNAAAAANCSSKRSSTNFSTSSDNQDDVNCTSLDVGYVSAIDATHRRAAPPSPTPDRRRQALEQPPATSADDVIEAFPVGDCRRRVDRLPAEVDAARTRPASDHVTRSTTNHEQVSGTSVSRASRPITWLCNDDDVILSSLNQRHERDRGIIATTP